MRLTLTQRILRPILNAAVEKFFPDGVIYGRDFFSIMKTEENTNGDKGNTPFSVRMCALHLTEYMISMDATRGVITASNMTINGNSVGDWLVTIEQILPQEATPND